MKKTFLSLVLTSSVIVSSCLSAPLVSAEADTEQIKTLLEGYIEQNYKGDAYIHDGEEDDVEVIFRKTSVEEPAFDTNAIYSEFDKFFKENNIDSSNVFVEFLEDSPVIPTSEKFGDINSDEKIDTTDLTVLSLTLIGDKALTEDQQKAADLDKDGKVALSDLARMRQYLSKIITSFD